jgi:hypothetical protein
MIYQTQKISDLRALVSVQNFNLTSMLPKPLALELTHNKLFSKTKVKEILVLA